MEAMQQDKHALKEAHVAELELQSGHCADLAAKLRKVQAFADTQACAVAAAEVVPNPIGERLLKLHYVWSCSSPAHCFSLQQQVVQA